jgi:hypothetical protein
LALWPPARLSLPPALSAPASPPAALSLSCIWDLAWPNVAPTPDSDLCGSGWDWNGRSDEIDGPSTTAGAPIFPCCPLLPRGVLVYQCISHALRLSWRIPALKGELSTAGTGCLYRALFASRLCSRFLILQVAVSTSFQPAFHGPNSATQDG